MTTRPLLAATLVAASLLTAAPAHAAAPVSPTPPGVVAGVQGHTQVVAHCTAYRQTPRRIVGACADEGAAAVVRQWTSWTAHQARGTGTLVLDTCDPDCASGTTERLPATFGLRRLVTAPDGTRVFSRLGVTYVRDGEPHDTTIVLPTTPLP